MVRAVAQAIFGSPGISCYRAISDGQRETRHTDRQRRHRGAHDDDPVQPAEERATSPASTSSPISGSSCSKDSQASGLGQLGGQKVCATGVGLGGTHRQVQSRVSRPSPPSWISYLLDRLPGPAPAARGGGVSTDDAILEGLQAQDPFTKLVGGDLTDEPYGLAIAKQHPEFVRFVNAVLARMYTDGAWEKSYNHWVSTSPRILRSSNTRTDGPFRRVGGAIAPRCRASSSACAFTIAPVSPRDPPVTVRRTAGRRPPAVSASK